MAKPLSKKQTDILKSIKDFMDENDGLSPTVRDIQDLSQISSTSVVDYNLRILQREEYVSRRTEVARGIALLKDWKGDDPWPKDIVSAPVLGAIAAGEAIHVPDDNRPPEEYYDVPRALVGNAEDVFALRVRGESMIDAHVTDGDIVILEPTTEPRNGEMVAAEIADEGGTLKHFSMRGGIVTLEPANPAFDPIVVPARDVAVKGKVVGVIRSMGR